MTRRRLSATALCTALVLAPALAGCSGGEDPQSAPASIEPGGSLQTMNADGLPADYPRKEVPLITGGEVTSVERGGKREPGYTVAILLDVSPTQAVARAVRLLERAGWQDRSSLAGDPPPVQVLRKGADQVIITNTVTGGHTLISYAISLS